MSYLLVVSGAIRATVGLLEQKGVVVVDFVRVVFLHIPHGRELFRHLKVYAGESHPHDAQTPEPLVFGGLTITAYAKDRKRR